MFLSVLVFRIQYTQYTCVYFFSARAKIMVVQLFDGGDFTFVGAIHPVTLRGYSRHKPGTGPWSKHCVCRDNHVGAGNNTHTICKCIKRQGLCLHKGDNWPVVKCCTGQLYNN
jgi:hypothetical protein